MKISDIEIRACKTNAHALKASDLREGNGKEFHFLVVTMHTDTGLQAESFGFASASALGAARLAADLLKPFFLGRNPMFREKNWQDFQVADRWWLLTPIYSYGPFDICCWLLAAKAAGLPLYQYIGAYRDRVPIYGSSLILSTPEEYARQAGQQKDAGWAAYKLHPPGRFKFDLEAYRLCREAVGEDFPLMADPVAAYDYAQALKMGRELEKLNYSWFEEPLPDVDFYGLKKLTAALDIPICGTEVISGSHYSAAQCIAEQVVDMVRSDVSWKGGITAVLKTAHLAESFGMSCELHTAIFQPLELVNLHCCAAIKNCSYLEVLLPTEDFQFGLKTPIPIEGGHAILPEGAGLGIDLDWDFIDNCTLEIL